MLLSFAFDSKHRDSSQQVLNLTFFLEDHGRKKKQKLSSSLKGPLSRIIKAHVLPGSIKICNYA